MLGNLIHLLKNPIKDIEEERVKFNFGIIKIVLASFIWIMFRSCVAITGDIIFKENYTLIIIYYLLSIPIFIVFLSTGLGDFGEEKKSIKDMNIRIIVLSVISIILYKVLAIEFLLPILIKLPQNDILKQVVEIGANENLIYSYGYLLVFSPIMEELFFRGIIFNGVKNRLNQNEYIAILISAILFGASHMNLPQAIYSSFLGIVLGIIYNKSKSLHLTIGCHMLNNIIPIIL